jgi:hypothetical protein
MRANTTAIEMKMQRSVQTNAFTAVAKIDAYFAKRYAYPYAYKLHSSALQLCVFDFLPVTAARRRPNCIIVAWHNYLQCYFCVICYAVLLLGSN